MKKMHCLDELHMSIAKLDVVVARLLLFVIWLVPQFKNKGRKDQNRKRREVGTVIG